MREHGILIIADEVQSGAGRTGRLFAFEHFDYGPDIIALAKGVAFGMSLRLTLARDDLMNWTPGTHASTFGGNPLSLAAAKTTLRLIKDTYLENCRDVGQLLWADVEGLMERHNIIGEVRGLGLMIGLDFVRDRETREPAGDVRNAVVQECLSRGLIVLGAGASTIRLSLPLVVDAEQSRFAVETLDGAIAAVSKS